MNQKKREINYLMTYLSLIKKSVICIICFCCFVGCNSFEREKELFLLLKKELNLNAQSIDNLDVYILQDDFCGACSQEIIDFMFDMIGPNSLLFMSDKNEKLVKLFKQKIEQRQIYIDDNRLIERYGLRYPKGIYIKIDKGEIKKWFFMIEDNFKKIEKTI